MGDVLIVIDWLWSAFSFDVVLGILAAFVALRIFIKAMQSISNS